MAEWTQDQARWATEGTLVSWLKDGGKLRQGRRTPETVYASFDDNLDDRTTNFPVTLIQNVDLAKFVVDAVNEKLERGRQTADPEAWLADQLAQVSVFHTVPANIVVNVLDPREETFAAVQKLAQEYGEMCAARALEGTEVEVRIDGNPSADADPFIGIVSMVGGKLVVRPK